MPPEPRPSLRVALGLHGLIVMYVGNLEPYQGVDLLLASFARVRAQMTSPDLVVVGGAPGDIQQYQAECRRLGIADHVHFVGPRPIDELGWHLSAADVVVCPRVHGHNTPMKLFSYLHSGKAVVATDLPTHTQVVTPEVAMLAAPTPDAFAAALLRVLADPALRARLGAAARAFVEAGFTYRAYRARLNGLLDWLAVETSGARS